MEQLVTSLGEIDFLFANRHNLADFHYATDDEKTYDYFCELVAREFELEVDPRTASNISKAELYSVNERYHLDLSAAYLNGPKCGCGRVLNGYDFVVNAVFAHGAGFLRERKVADGARFIMPFRRAMNALVCTDCGDMNPLAAGSWYKDSSSIDTYGPCCSK